MKLNCLLAGVGGQGTVLASKLLAAAAMSKDIPVMSAETIGMAQRGGSVFSHLRMGDNLYSPMIETGTADLIIGCDPIVTADVTYSPSMIADAMKLTADARVKGAEMPATTIIPSVLITKENAAQYYFPDSPF